MGRYSGFKYKIYANNIYQFGLLFDLASDYSCCKPSRPSSNRGVVNCCKQSATLGTCRWQASSVVDTKVEHEAGELLFAVWHSC